MARRSRLRVLGKVDYVDLRKISAQSRFLFSVVKRFDMGEHLDCVVFTNSAKTRFRLVINMHGVPFLDIPPIDEKGKHSMYLKISEYLSVFADMKGTRIELEGLKTLTEERIRRQRARRKSIKE